MSLEAMKWVVADAPDVPANALAVLYGLANHANPDGADAFPSVERLAFYARKKERAVQRDLRELEELGLIRKGDQRAAYHLEPRYRPTVWDLALERSREAFIPERLRDAPQSAEDANRGVADDTPATPGVSSMVDEGCRPWSSGVSQATPEPPTQPALEPSTEQPGQSSHVSNARASAPRPTAALQPHASSPTAELDPAPRRDGDPPAELGGRGHQELMAWRKQRWGAKKPKPDHYGETA